MRSVVYLATPFLIFNNWIAFVYYGGFLTFKS